MTKPSSALATAAHMLPDEDSGRGTFLQLDGDRVSLPEKSVRLPTADMVRETRPDLAAALESPADNM